MLLAEANQWPEDAAAYFGGGDECHMNFHFPLMPRMFMAVHLEDRFPIVDILRQTPTIPPSCQWAIFLRNHDELTLEMVTDEDRDYMYRVYAEDPNARINLGIRRRLAPLVKGRRKIELMNALLMSLPGTPVLYYGDEIGMGDNIYLGDRDGVRTPMQWSADRNAGFSRANPQKLYLPVIIDPEYHYESNNVQAQQANASSLLWWTKRLIALRKEYEVLGTGNIEFLYPDNNKILAFIRAATGGARVLVVINLSRFAQGAELDLSAYAGTMPVEMFGRTPFPAIGDRPYFLSLGPHSFYWFTLEQPAEKRADDRAASRRARGAGAVDARLRRARRAASSPRGAARVRGRRAAGSAARRARARAAASPTSCRSTGTRGRASSCSSRSTTSRAIPSSTWCRWRSSAATRRTASSARRRARWSRACVVRDKGGEIEGLLVDGIAHDTPARLMESIQKRITLVGEQGSWRRSRCAPSRRSPATIRWCRGRASSSRPTRRCSSATRCCSRSTARSSRGPTPSSSSARFFTERGATQHAAHARRHRVSPPTRQEPATLATVQELVPNEGVAWALGAVVDRSLLRARAAGARHRCRRTRRCRAARCCSRRRRSRRAPMPELLGGFIGARAAARRSAPPRCTSCSRPSRSIPAFAPAAVHRLLPAVAVPGRAQAVGAHRRDAAQEAAVVPRVAARDGARRLRRRGASSTRGCATSPTRKLELDAHPRARRSAPRPGARHRQRLRHHRLRGRAGAHAVRAALQALPARRRRRACCARSTTRPSRRCARAGCAPRTRRP